MSISALTTSMPSWVLFVLIFIIGILAAEFGAFITQRREKEAKETSQPSGSMVGATLGLLAFMLGLTFSLTASRYNERKHLLVNEANAIGTSFLRSELIPEKQKLESRKIFGEYI